MKYTEEEKKDIEMCNIFVNQNAMISYVDCDEKGNLIFPQCDAKPIQTLLNLIEKQQKEIEELKYKYKKYGKVLFTEDAIKENYVSKNEIREKIKELENQKVSIKVGFEKIFEAKMDNAKIIDTLRELLRGE